MTVKVEPCGLRVVFGGLGGRHALGEQPGPGSGGRCALQADCRFGYHSDPVLPCPVVEDGGAEVHVVID